MMNCTCQRLCVVVVRKTQHGCSWRSHNKCYSRSTKANRATYTWRQQSCSKRNLTKTKNTSWGSSWIGTTYIVGVASATLASLFAKRNVQEEATIPHGQLHRAVQQLQTLDIRLVAIDFDMTLVHVHTDGAWDVDHVKELVRCVRPVFRQLLPILLDSDISVAIVTKSPQVDLIDKVLEYSLGRHISDRIAIRGGLGIWFAPYGGNGLGKQSHIASLEHGLEPYQILLIDDDPMNILFAKRGGVQCCCLDPCNVNELFDDIDALRA